MYLATCSLAIVLNKIIVSANVFIHFQSTLSPGSDHLLRLKELDENCCLL